MPEPTNNKTTAHRRKNLNTCLNRPTTKQQITPTKEPEHMPIPTNNKTTAHTDERTWAHVRTDQQQNNSSHRRKNLNTCLNRATTKQQLTPRWKNVNKCLNRPTTKQQIPPTKENEPMSEPTNNKTTAHTDERKWTNARTTYNTDRDANM